MINLQTTFEGNGKTIINCDTASFHVTAVISTVEIEMNSQKVIIAASPMSFKI